MRKKKFRSQSKQIANLFRTLGQPARLRILMTIGESEACVCHLEVALGHRQAYISQHLMELRKAGILDARRDGRFIFYRLRDVTLLQLIREAGKYFGFSDLDFDMMSQVGTLPKCCCPNCVSVSLTSAVVEKHIST